MNVLLVHGMFSSGGEFPRLCAALKVIGHRCFIPQLRPRDAHKGIVDLAYKLDHYIKQAIPADEKFAIVGFSMGCLISRYYIQNIDKEQRVAAFFNISGPHYGSYLAYLYMGQGAKDLRPGSHFLRELNAYGKKFKKIPTYSYRLKFDHIIIPGHSSDWGEGSKMVLGGGFHAFFPFHRRVVADISQRLWRLENQITENGPQSDSEWHKFDELKIID